MIQNKYDTIIVGGGIAGLTSAAYLSSEGKKILLIEKNDKCGGLVNSFSHNGFHFEAGVRALEDAGIIFPMLKDLGIGPDSNISVEQVRLISNEDRRFETSIQYILTTNLKHLLWANNLSAQISQIKYRIENELSKSR